MAVGGLANQQLLEALRRVGGTSRSVEQNSRYTPPAGGRLAINLNDDRLRALRAAPQMADQINSIASGEAQPSGAAGTIGRVLLDNPISKVALNALTTIDTPRRAVISGVRELVDLVDSDPATQASLNDWKKQVADPTYGFGTAFPMDGWRGRVLGFVGDVALDPITYATFGSYVPVKAGVKAGMYAGKSLREALGVRTLAGADGRFALSRLAKQMGASDDVVKDVAARGRLGLTPELANNMGVKRAGIYYFGTRVRVPLSGPVADLLQRGLVKTRLGFFSTPMGERVGRQFALRGGNRAADTSEQRFRLATGKLSPSEAGAFVSEFAAEDVYRARRRIAVDTAVKYSRQLLDDPNVEANKNTVYRLLDAPQEKWSELGLNPSAAEIAAYERIRPVFEQMHRDVEKAFTDAGIPVSFGEIKDYFPWVASEQGLRMMSDQSSPYALQIRQYLTVNQTDNVGSFRSRALRAGSEWFGRDGKYPPLTQADIDGGAARLNQLFRERTGLDFNFFETDIKKVLERYSGYYGHQVGSANYMKYLMESGDMQLARVVPEFNQEIMDIVNGSVRTATNNVSVALKSVYDTGQRVSATLSEVFGWSSRAKATVSRPVGPLRKNLADAKSALKGVLPEDVAAARLQSAKDLLLKEMANLEAAYKQFSDQFFEDSEYLQMMLKQKDDLVRAHQDVLDEIDYIVKNYADEISPSGRVGIVQDISKAVDSEVDAISGKPQTLAERVSKLRNQLSDLDAEIVSVNNTWTELLTNQKNFLNDFERLVAEPFAGIGQGPADKILGVFRFVDRGKGVSGLKTVRGQKLFSPWGGDNVTKEVADLRAQLDPFNEFSVNELSKMDINKVRETIAYGFSSGADLRELRKAAVWLAARDVIVGGGRVPTDAEFFGRFAKLKSLVNRANAVESFIRDGQKGLEDFVRTGKKGLVQLEEQAKNLEGRMQHVFDKIENFSAQLDEVQARVDTGLASDSDVLLRLNLTRAVDEFTELHRNLTRDYDRAVRQSDVLKSKKTPEQIEAMQMMAGGRLDEFAEEFSEGVSEYYFHSQVQVMFNEVMEEASRLGLVPTERMYNALVSKVTEYDLELAQAMVRRVDDARNVLSSVRDRVKAYPGPDQNQFFLNELMDLFENPARKADADTIRDMFPEVEAMMYKHRHSMRVSRAMFEADRGEEIAFKISEVMDSVGLPFDAGTITTVGARRVPRAKTLRMDGLDVSDDFVESGIRPSIDKYSEAAELDARAAAVKKYIEKLRVYGKSLDESTSSGESLLRVRNQKQMIDAVIKEYDDMIVRVNKNSAASKAVIAKMTGARGGRTIDRRLQNILKLGESFGVSSPLKRAFEGGPYALDSFFADLIGGTKLDLSAGYRTQVLQGRKLVRAAEGRDAFVNVFEDASNPGRFIDGNGNAVNQQGQLLDDKGEVIMERVVDSSIGGEGFILRPKEGRKSPRPTVLIPSDRSQLGKVRNRALSRYHKLRSISDDAEFTPAGELMRGSIDSKGETTWLLSDNLYGPRAYANRLEAFLQTIDERIKQAGPITKEMKKAQKELREVNKRIATSRPTKPQAENLRSRVAAAAAASRKLDELTSSDLHLRAIEREQFHYFLFTLASIDPNMIPTVRWNLSALDSGFPVSRDEVLKVNNLHIRALEKNVSRMRREAEEILKMPASRVKMRSVRLGELRRGIDDSGAEIARLRAQVDEARLPVGSPDDFSFTRDEFMSLWSDELTPQRVGELRTEYSRLSGQLNARVGQQHTPVYRSWGAQKIADNDNAIQGIKTRMEEINGILDTAAVRDVAIRKAKFLFDNFEDAGYQSSVQVSNYKTVSSKTTRPSTTARVGDTAVKGRELGSRVVDREPVAVKGHTALRRFLKRSNVLEKSTPVADRRRGLREVYQNSPEFLHMQEVVEARNAIKAAEDARLTAFEKRNKLVDVKRRIERTIAEKRKELQDLEIGAQVDNLNKIIEEAGTKVGRRLPKAGKAEPLKGGAKARAALEKEIIDAREGRIYFTKDEEMFGTLREANENQLSALQARRRDLLQQIEKLNFVVLAEKQAQKEAEEAIKMLVAIGERQAKLLGLPSINKIRANIKLAKGLPGKKLRTAFEETPDVRIAAARNAAEASGRKVDETKAKIASTWADLGKKVEDAQASFDLSSTSRRSLEENVDLAERQIAEVRELAQRNAEQRKGMKKKTDEWTESFESFMEEASFLMDVIKGTEYEKPLKDQMAAYVSAKAQLTMARFNESSALQEQKMLNGIKNLVATDADEAALRAAYGGNFSVVPPVNMVKVFDEGFVQLSRYYPDVAVRKELAEIVQNVHRAQDPLIVKELSKFLSTYTKFFKGYATLSPGFHVRNAMTNGFMLFAAGGRPQFLADGLQWSKSWTGASAAGRTFDQWIATVPQAQREAVRQAMMASAASGGGLVDEALSQGALWGTKTSKKVGQWLEQHSRFLLAYDGIRSGMDMQQAAARVRRFLVDYENVSNADLVLRQIIPFWMWASRNLPMQLLNIWQNPRSYQIYGALKRNLEDDENQVPVPLWMREMGAFRLPFGKNIYATPDFGFNRLNQDIEQLRDPARFASNMNPLIRLPIELMGDRQLYSGRPFSDQPVEVQGGPSSVIQPLLQALGYGETGPTGRKFVDDKAYYALRSLIPTLSQAERLIPSTPAYQERGVRNPLLGYLGVPARQVTPQMSESEVRRMQAQLRDIAKRGKTLMEGDNR